jgi:hypothetical protein
MDPRYSRYRHGDHNVIDQRSGFKVKSSATAIEWTQLQVRKEREFELRNPQDFAISTRDHQAPPWVRSENVDRFLPDVIDPDNPYTVDFLATQDDQDIITQDNQCIEIRTFGDFLSTQDDLLIITQTGNTLVTI